MNIYDGNRLIRTLKRKAPTKTGVHKWTWGMREKGGDRPSRNVRPRRGEQIIGYRLPPALARSNLLFLNRRQRR